MNIQSALPRPRPGPNHPRALIFRGPSDGSFTMLDDEFVVSIGGIEAGHLGFSAEADVYIDNGAAIAVITSLEFGGEPGYFGTGHILSPGEASRTEIIAALSAGDEDKAFELMLARRMAATLENDALDERAHEVVYGI